MIIRRDMNRLCIRKWEGGDILPYTKTRTHLYSDLRSVLVKLRHSRRLNPIYI